MCVCVYVRVWNCTTVCQSLDYRDYRRARACVLEVTAQLSSFPPEHGAKGEFSEFSSNIHRFLFLYIKKKKKDEAFIAGVLQESLLSLANLASNSRIPESFALRLSFLYISHLKRIQFPSFRHLASLRLWNSTLKWSCRYLGKREREVHSPTCCPTTTLTSIGPPSAN